MNHAHYQRNISILSIQAEKHIKMLQIVNKLTFVILACVYALKVQYVRSVS